MSLIFPKYIPNSLLGLSLSGLYKEVSVKHLETLIFKESSIKLLKKMILKPDKYLRNDLKA